MEIDLDGAIPVDILNGIPVEEVEDILNKSISTKLTEAIVERIDEMDFIDLELDEETQKFMYKAEMVLYSKSSVVTNIQLQAQKLSEYGLTSEQITHILEIATLNTKGF